MSLFTDALQYAGDALGKGGRAVRGVLAGRPDEALALLPFSDSLGLTDEKRAVGGTELLNHWGVADESGWGGTAVELLADPLNFVSGAGLASRAAKGAKLAAGAAAPVARDAGRVLSAGADFARSLRKGGDAHAAARGMLPARRDFTFLKSFDDADALAPHADRAEDAMRAGLEVAEPGSPAQQRVIEEFQRQASRVQSLDVGDDRPLLFRPVGGNWRGRTDELAEAARDHTRLYSGGGPLALYDPAARAGNVSPGWAGRPRAEVRPVERHELAHGVMDRAAAGGTGANLPPAMRGVTTLKGAESSFVRGLGEVADEAVAQGLSGTSPARFALNPDAAYLPVWSAREPGLGRAVDQARRLRGPLARGASLLDELADAGLTPGRTLAAAGTAAATLPAAAGLYYALGHPDR